MIKWIEPEYSLVTLSNMREELDSSEFRTIDKLYLDRTCYLSVEISINEFSSIVPTSGIVTFLTSVKNFEKEIGLGQVAILVVNDDDSYFIKFHDGAVVIKFGGSIIYRNDNISKDLLLEYIRNYMNSAKVYLQKNRINIDKIIFG